MESLFLVRRGAGVAGCNCDKFRPKKRSVGRVIALRQRVSAMCIRRCGRRVKKVSNGFLLGLLAVVFPLSSLASVSAVLSWNPSTDPTVTGYTIYYGSVSHQYTNSVPVGNVTNVLIPGLVENTTYYFAAKASNSNGVQSDFSNEAAFAGFLAKPDSHLRLATVLAATNGDALVFSLAAGAPAGASINSTNGTLYWNPGREYAATTNYLTVNVTDTVNPALSTSETMVIVVGDYLEFDLGGTAVSAGGAGSLPLSVALSGGATNLQVTVSWPGSALGNPTLTFFPPVIAGTLLNQDGELVIQLQTPPDQPLTGTNVVAQVNFQAAAGQTSAILSIPASAGSGVTTGGQAYANVLTQGGEVVVVGDQAILRPQVAADTGRSLWLYANPGTYQLLYTTSLAQPVVWTPLMTYEQTNVAQMVSLDATNDAIFYRLLQN
jgi:hypothetical protein